MEYVPAGSFSMGSDHGSPDEAPVHRVSVSAFLDPGAPAISTVSTPAKTHNTSSVTLTGTSVAGQTITIYDGSSSIKTVTVGSGGTWTASVSLGIGSHVLTATQSPAAGLQSAPSAARTVTVLYG